MTNTPTQITEDEFNRQYSLVPNHFNSNASWTYGEGPGYLFETYGEELAFVRAQNPRNVWTLMEGENGDFLLSGLHLVNRIGFLISTNPIPPNTIIQVRISFESDEEVSENDEAYPQRRQARHAGPQILAALRDLLGDLPSVQNGVCRHCGRDYNDIVNGDCPSDDCPSFNARVAIAQATGGACLEGGKPIVIEVRGGIVQDVLNVPPGYEYEVKDYDNIDADEETAGRPS